MKNLRWSLYLVALVSLLFVFMPGTALAQDDPVHPCCDLVPSSQGAIVAGAINPAALTETASQFSLSSNSAAALVAASLFGELSEPVLTQPDALADRTLVSTSVPEGSAWYGYRRLA